MLAVNLAVLGCPRFCRWSEDSRILDNALEEACHSRSTSFLPVEGLYFLQSEVAHDYQSNLLAQRTQATVKSSKAWKPFNQQELQHLIVY